MTFGVVPEGFNPKDLQTILEEIESDQRSLFGPGINTQADSVLGQLNGVFGDKIAELWEVGQAVYRSRQADSASGEALDNLGAFTGALRLPATPSKATLGLNIDPGVTLPIGTIVSIGAVGARWVTTSELTNTGVDQATLPVVAESEEAAPIVGNEFSIDTIVTPIAGWSAKAAINSLNSEPFALEDLQTLRLEIDEGPTQIVVFNTADFANIAAATAQEVIDAITASVTGLDGLDVSGFIRLFSDLDGTGSAIRIVGGTAYEALGFSQALSKGFNPSSPAQIVNANNETYDMSGGPTLFVAIDGGPSQTITFSDSDFGTAAKGSLSAIAASLLAVGVDTDTFVLNDGVNSAVTFVFDDDGSVVETPTTRAVNHNGTQTAGQMRDLIVAAINTSPALEITASPGPTASIVNLINGATGVAGNVAIIETVANATFLVAGMAGGVADAPPLATAIQVARAINNQLSGGVSYEAQGKVQIESLVAGTNSQVEITGGTANIPLGFTVSDPQAGVSGDAVLGRDVETDADFRQRREDLLRIAGSATVEAIRSSLLNLPDVLQAFVFENTTDFVDGNGRPPHSIEAVVSGATDLEVATTIFNSKAAGIETFRVSGTSGVEVVITDSQGVNHTIRFSRPDEIQMYVSVDINVVADEFGAGSQVNGEQQVREAIKAVGDALQIGEDVIILPFQCAPLGVAGVKDVPAIRIEDIDPPTNTSNITIDPRELATFAIADIDINVTFV